MADQVEKSVVRRIKPSHKDYDRVNNFVRKLVHTAEAVTNLECIPCGSIGKGTWLVGDHDIDLFVIFPTDTKRNELEKQGRVTKLTSLLN